MKALRVALSQLLNYGMAPARDSHLAPTQKNAEACVAILRRDLGQCHRADVQLSNRSGSRPDPRRVQSRPVLEASRRFRAFQGQDFLFRFQNLAFQFLLPILAW